MGDEYPVGSDAEYWAETALYCSRWYEDDDDVPVWNRDDDEWFEDWHGLA